MIKFCVAITWGPVDLEVLHLSVRPNLQDRKTKRRQTEEMIMTSRPRTGNDNHIFLAAMAGHDTGLPPTGEVVNTLAIACWVEAGLMWPHCERGKGVCACVCAPQTAGKRLLQLIGCHLGLDLPVLPALPLCSWSLCFCSMVLCPTHHSSPNPGQN